MSENILKNSLVIRPKKTGHVSDIVIKQLIDEIGYNKIPIIKNYYFQINKVISRFDRLFQFFFGKLSFESPLIFLNGDWKLNVPYIFYQSKIKILWTYDLWEPLYAHYEEMIVRFKINILFSSNKKSVDHFNSRQIDGLICCWIPEGVNTCHYQSDIPISKRKIDVMQFGRKWDDYHERIKDELNANKVTHLYEEKKGDIIFQSEKLFLEGLGNTKISICIPSNITHPERSGSISTVTNRYLQSFSSKNIVLGIEPDEMKFLFNYTPIIPIDFENPVDQILNILSNTEYYNEMVERNYNETKINHQWKNRIKMVDHFLNQYMQSKY